MLKYKRGIPNTYRTGTIGWLPTQRQMLKTERRLNMKVFVN
jgi:hypothetical protein